MTATLFDFDGVLVDSEPTHLAAFNDVLAAHGLSISEKEYLETYMALDDAGVFRAVLSRGRRTLREEEVRSLVAAKNPRFMARFEQTFRTFPGAAELVARARGSGPGRDRVGRPRERDRVRAREDGDPRPRPGDRQR